MPAGPGQQCSIGFQACIEKIIAHSPVKSATTWEWLKAVAHRYGTQAGSPCFLERPSSGDGTPSLKDLFLRVQAGIFSDRAQPALHPES